MSKSKHILAASISLAASASLAHAEQLPPLNLTPDLGKISPDVRKRLSDIIVKQSLSQKLATPFLPNASGANPDPDYSEFWVELRPAGGENEISPDLKDALKAYQKSNPAAQVLTNPGDGFGEDTFTEITPDFADMSPPVDDLRSTRKPNVTLGINAIEDGKLITEPNFYKEILKSIQNN